MPPNTQGIAALEMLNIVEGFDLKALRHNTAPFLHLLVEAKRIAYADRDRYLADPAAVPPPVTRTLLSKEYAATRRREIDPAHAAKHYAPGVIDAKAPTAGPWDPVEIDGRDRGDTIYLTAADEKGNVISLIQSLFSGFGAGIVAGETGIALHNRGSGFVLTPGHPNQIAPHKRPFHTLVPAMILKDGKPYFSFGVMGGDMQAQGHAQVVINLIDFRMNPQEAGEAPRFRHSDQGVALEMNISAEARDGLAQRGHKPITAFGSDPRKDGLAIGY
jgi:gamma-glutamyltranspeptidase/glutathione hydrolase